MCRGIGAVINTIAVLMKILDTIKPNINFLRISRIMLNMVIKDGIIQLI